MHSYTYHPRIRARGVEDPSAHNFPYSFDDEILATDPKVQKDGSLLYQKVWLHRWTGRIVRNSRESEDERDLSQTMETMKNLTLSADYLDFGLQEDGLGSVNVADLAVPASLVDALVAWNWRYQEIMLMEVDDRRTSEARSLIDELDREGLVLAQKISEGIPVPVKVNYFSEGLLRRLP
jgi:hypothetical protein